ncbi:MAG: DUF4159 domain-containing protein [Planctomycetota bacterium]|nr:DUF4159 domain-containing protein [Planctomycetota bacterium]MDA1211854.1 DUF4159 domain-containing protein [Planctomycetota bacterium]
MLPSLSRIRSNIDTITASVLAVWMVAIADWFLTKRLPAVVTALFMLAAVGYLGRLAFQTSRQPIRAIRTLNLQLSALFIVTWPFVVWVLDMLELREASAIFARWGTGGLFCIGLAWFVWGMELASQRFERMRHQRDTNLPRSWHPLDVRAWYYGERSPKLRQSLAGLLSYSLMFLFALLLFSQLSGCQELYEMPAGGGEQQTVAQTVKLQKIIKKKFVVNPFSAILFKVPPIDEIKLQLTEITKHAYTVGYGQGEGAGYAGGTKQGKVRFIRIEYAGGDWDQDFGVGSDLNMLMEYGLRTNQPVNSHTESRTIEQLKNFPVGSSPPFVFMTGQGSISLSSAQVKILREYLDEKHGMLFIDNGGSGHFHNQVLAMMRNVLPQVRPTPIPLDDIIHRVPFQIPFLPYVAPHGGKEALGWRVDGRLVCYYHPGDIADAWADDHAGVPPEIWEACYQLGTNVINYAHAEYSKWLVSRGAAKK